MTKDYVKNNKAFLAIFAAIFIIGIFLRVYNFEKLLVFGFDQSRDASIAKHVLEGKADYPLLGAHAMGTRFKLGPIYYYFQIASAWLFGPTPKAMAYPDLFFSIFTIPVLFLFLRRYFKRNASLALTGLWSISFFAVKFSRFAWNPNSLPFFTLLMFISLLELSKDKITRKTLWLVVFALSIGIGIQLHTLFLFIAPPLSLIFLFPAIRDKKINWKNILAVIILILAVNFPQLISEYQTHGKNTKDLIKGIIIKFEENTDLVHDAYLDLSCHIQANSIIISSFGNYTTCSFGDLAARSESPLHKASLIIRIMASLVFSIIGYVLLIYFIRKQPNEDKKKFLKLIGLFIILSMVTFFPLGDDITDRYYLVFAFVPIVLLGLTYEYLKTKTDKAPAIGCLALIVLVTQNGLTMEKYFTPFKRMGLLEDSMFVENKFLSDFVLENSLGQNSAYIDQKQGNWRTMGYFLEDKINAIHVSGKINVLDPALPYFFITDNAHLETIDKIKKDLPDYHLAKQASFGRFTIALFRKS